MRRLGLVVMLVTLLLVTGAFAATKKPKPTPTPTPTSTSSCGAPITVTSAATLTGCYRSTDPAVPAVKISTTEAVVLDHARVEHTGKGVEDTVTGSRVTTKDTTYQQLPLSTVVNHRAIELEGVASFTAEYNKLVDGDGMWIGGPTTGAVAVRFNEASNIGRYPHPTTSNCCVQFVQFDHVVSDSIEVGWNKITNQPGQSDAEDVINFYYSGGTDSAHRSNVHHNLVDGAYSKGLNDPQFTGGGINIADAGAAHNLAHDNVIVSTTNYGVSAHQDDNYANDNLLINDGAEQASDFGQAVVAFQNVTPAGSHTTGNQYNWHRSINDTNQWPCYQEAFCSGGTQVGLSEDQGRTQWDATRANAGVIVGPRP